MPEPEELFADQIQEGSKLDMQEEPKEPEKAPEATPPEPDDSTPPEPAPADTEPPPTGEPEPDGEVKAPEVTGEPEPADKNPTTGKQYYTDAEVLELMTRGDNGKYVAEFDSSRVKPGTVAEAMYKRMEAQFTPQLQEKAELSRTVEELKQRFETMQSQQTQKQDEGKTLTWQGSFDKDPVQTMRMLDQRIGDADPLSDEGVQLRRIKDAFVTQTVEKTVNMQQAQVQNTEHQQIVVDAQSAIRQEIPDYFDHVTEYDKTARELGFSETHIGILTDTVFWKRLEQQTGAPVGSMPVTIAKAIVNMHKRAAAPLSPEQVLQKKTPTKVESPGAGGHDEQPAVKWGESDAFNERMKSHIT